jgi:hypothetical protein
MLEKFKGEAILQSAHAHLNIADIFLEAMDPRAVTYIVEALKRYQKYPYTSQADLADAMATLGIALACLDKSVPLPFLVETWAALRAVPFPELTETRVMGFLLVFLPVSRSVSDEYYLNVKTEMTQWAGPLFASRVLRAVGDDEGLVTAIQRALFGSPTDDEH